jgi:TrmH family RNA methyltransferase
MLEDTVITSPKNPLVGRFRDAGSGDAAGLMLIEGKKLVDEALAARLVPIEAAVEENRLEAHDDLLRALRGARARVHVCSPAVFQKLSSVTTPQGVAAVFERPHWQDQDLLGKPPALVVIAAGVKEPGNLGALLRTTEAAGGRALLALRGGADPFREKAVRGAAGSLFRVPVRGGVSVEDALAMVTKHGLRLYVADEGGDLEYLDADFRQPCALVLGGEGEGIPPQLSAAAHARLRVPMGGKVESLNVAVAAGVLLYEARRQRR